MPPKPFVTYCSNSILQALSLPLSLSKYFQAESDFRPLAEHPHLHVLTDAPVHILIWFFSSKSEGGVRTGSVKKQKTCRLMLDGSVVETGSTCQQRADSSSSTSRELTV